MAPTLFTSCNALPPEGALRLRTGRARSAAPAGEEKTPTLAVSRTPLLPSGLITPAAARQKIERADAWI